MTVPEALFDKRSHIVFLNTLLIAPALRLIPFTANPAVVDKERMVLLFTFKVTIEELPPEIPVTAPPVLDKLVIVLFAIVWVV